MQHHSLDSRMVLGWLVILLYLQWIEEIYVRQDMDYNYKQCIHFILDAKYLSRYTTSITLNHMRYNNIDSMNKVVTFDVRQVFTYVNICRRSVLMYFETLRIIFYRRRQANKYKIIWNLFNYLYYKCCSKYINEHAILVVSIKGWINSISIFIIQTDNDHHN